MTLNLDIPDDMPAVRADEQRLSQILFNLVHNAVKYTDEGSITVRAKRDKQGHAVIEVEDTGIGIEEDALELIFQPYEQALQELARQAYDLVISDIMMPRISGYELTRTIRERYTLSELPVLLLTARSDPKDIWAGFQSY